MTFNTSHHNNNSSFFFSGNNKWLFSSPHTSSSKLNYVFLRGVWIGSDNLRELPPNDRPPPQPPLPLCTFSDSLLLPRLDHPNCPPPRVSLWVFVSPTFPFPKIIIKKENTHKEVILNQPSLPSPPLFLYHFCSLVMCCVLLCSFFLL